MHNPFKTLLLMTIVSIGFLSGSGKAQEQGITGLTAEPNRIEIGTFYHGTELHIEAEIPPCDGAVVKIEGRDEEMVLNKKGKVAVIWLNVSQVTVKNAPQVYLLAASDEIKKLSDLKEREEFSLGLDALKRKVQFESDKPLSGDEFDEFIKLKEHSGTYSLNNKINLSPLDNNRQQLETTLPITSAVPPGSYKVQLFCFQDGNMIDRGEVQITIEKVSLPKLLTSLGFDHPALYGIVAIVIAMLAGIIMGVIFSSKAGH